MFRRAPGNLAFLVLAATGCWQVADEQAAERTQAIVGGTNDVDHPAVVALVRTSTSALCSGTLVGGATVLTAAHCVYGVAPSDLVVRIGADVTAPDREIAVTRTAVYPGFTGLDSDRLGGLDLGAVYLAQDAGIAPIVIGATPTAGAMVTLVGYGASDGPTSTGAGLRRAVTLPVATVCTRMMRDGGDTANACVGDSGGAVLSGGGAGRGHLVGPAGLRRTERRYPPRSLSGLDRGSPERDRRRAVPELPGARCHLPLVDSELRRRPGRRQRGRRRMLGSGRGRAGRIARLVRGAAVGAVARPPPHETRGRVDPRVEFLVGDTAIRVRA